MDAGADFEIIDKDHGLTALMWARIKGHDHIVEILKSAGAIDRPEPRFSKHKIQNTLAIPSFFLMGFSVLIMSLIMIPKVRWSGIRFGVFDRNSLKYATYYRAFCQKENKSCFWYYIFIITFYLGASGFAVVMLVSVDIRFAALTVVLVVFLHKILHSN